MNKEEEEMETENILKVTIQEDLNATPEKKEEVMDIAFIGTKDIAVMKNFAVSCMKNRHVSFSREL